MHVCVCLCVCKSMCPWSPEECLEFPRAGITGSFEPPQRGCQELNLGSLADQYVLFTTEPPLWHYFHFFKLSVTRDAINTHVQVLMRAHTFLCVYYICGS